MEGISKALQLGVIILALQLLGNLKVRAPRIVARVAALFGVSRKAGYHQAKRLLERLQEESEDGEDRKLGREVQRLRIRNQVLAYERDHPEVRFEDRQRHLPAEARSLCVRILRDFKRELSESQIAELIGVPLSSLKRWDKEADSTLPQKPERRGRHRRRTPQDEDRVVGAYKALEESMTLQEFTEHFRGLYPDRPLDRKTITRILQERGLVKVEVRDLPEPYHGKVEVYFPGAQAAVDATECEVVFTGENPERLKFTREVAIDLSSLTILGDVLELREYAEGVQRVVIRAQQECAGLLAVLSDNSSANRAAGTQSLVRRESALGPIFSFPYHPRTNGHLEGFFGQFSRIVGMIEIDDSSRETIARSVIEVVWRIFVYYHQYSPRKRLGGLGPLEYLRSYAPLPEEVERARKELGKRQRRSQALRGEHPRLSDESFRRLVERIVREHCFEVEVEEAMKWLLHYDRRVIESSSSAFFAQSARDGFDERKRTFAYFMGIVRNKQKSVDEARRQSHWGDLQTQQQRDEREAAERKIQQEKRQEEEDLKHHPERVILKYSKLLLSAQLRWMLRPWLGKVREALKALVSLRGRARHELERLGLEIRSWTRFREELKERMVDLLVTEYQAVIEDDGPR